MSTILTHVPIITGVMLGATHTRNTPSPTTPPWTCCRKLALTKIKLIKPCFATLNLSFSSTQSSTKPKDVVISSIVLLIFSAQLSILKTRSILNMANFLDSTSTHIKLNSAHEEVHPFISQTIIKEKLVFIITMKQINAAPILKFTVMNYVPSLSAIIISVSSHIIKLNKFIIQAVTSLNFANLTQTRI